MEGLMFNKSMHYHYHSKLPKNQKIGKITIYFKNIYISMQ